MLSKPFILNELNKPSPPRSEDYVVDWSEKEIMAPVNIYVDFLASNGAAAVTDSKLSCIYNIHVLNAIRNNSANTNIAISEQSPIIRAGKYVCLISTQKDLVNPRLFFYDFNKNPAALDELGNGLDETSRYILNEIQNYITDNLDQVSQEIVLVEGEPKGASLS